MTSQSHLTIQDYFHRMPVRRRNSAKGMISGTKADPAENGRFQRLLAARKQVSTAAADNKLTGLTLADYRANALRARYPRAVRRAAAASPTAGRKPTGAVQQVTIEKTIHRAARKYNLSPALIKGVIRAESNFQVRAVSHAGARGLMQLMPSTARELGVADPFDIAQNIDGGCRYLRRMLDHFDGDVKLALAAYNAGPGAVIKYGGRVPYHETRQYVDRVLRFSRQLT